MKIDDFVLENWLNPACDSEKNKIYLGGSCVSPLTVEELFELTGESMEKFMENLKKMNLGYPRFEGTPRTRQALSKLYKNVKPEEIILCHGGTGANSTVCYTLLDEKDNIVSIMPNYQQFFSIPRSIGTELREVDLLIKDGYKLDLSQVRKAVDKNTKAIMFTNPNNPTLSSPKRNSSALPSTGIPMALMLSARKLSPSSTTMQRFTPETKERMSFPGRGQVKPSFRIDASGAASRTCW